MKKTNQDGIAHIIGLIFGVVVIGIIGFTGWKVLGANKQQDQQGKSSTKSTIENKPDSAPSELIWQQTANGWQSTQTPPKCIDPLILVPPADLKKATSVLYPGQTRGGNYKPHGGLRFDSAPNNAIEVTAPIDGFLVRGGQYLAEGEIQYTFDVMNSCGIMYRVGHLRELPANLQKIANTWPKAVEGDSRTQSIVPAVLVNEGVILATKVGIVKDKNVFFDWGVYDYRSENEASKSTAYQQKHANEKELAWHAVCWFDLMSNQNEAIVRSLPAGDPASGKTSDYCK